MPAAIRTSGLTRTFRTKSPGSRTFRLSRTPRTPRTVEAVRGIDLTVEQGEILGFLGPNGAGKTTTLRMLTTLLPPSSGTATVAGHDLRADPRGVRRRIGYVAQSGGTDPAVRVHEELTTQARLYRLSSSAAARRTRELAADLDLTGLLDRPCGALSGGQRRRLDIAMALTHDPALLFLDEPTTGLDPGSRAEVWRLVRRLRDERGVTVFLTTHYLDEADALADRLVIVADGRIAAQGSSAELRRTYGGSAEAGLHEAFLAVTGRPVPREEQPPVAV
ncbi:ABC transporter ATP-binding protein [Streptomyces sp. AA1529]|uniref:ABC transporter ATP-binding protein n=1 Tax=Streptomyces sp. AA1529 TaxID=1203257 RepID=UPI003D75BC3E